MVLVNLNGREDQASSSSMALGEVDFFSDKTDHIHIAVVNNEDDSVTPRELELNVCSLSISYACSISIPFI